MSQPRKSDTDDVVAPPLVHPQVPLDQRLQALQVLSQLAVTPHHLLHRFYRHRVADLPPVPSISRQFVAALDGLAAWETVKEKTDNIEDKDPPKSSKIQERRRHLTLKTLFIKDVKPSLQVQR
ncbi:hypothetical protein HID58_071452 [Brassica napus]|uniref:Uncharacterized protein n=1 Tax=Brassica napus TaxID=3708 RepID=A0ABQ7Z1S0_BRANA|nr:hypothetical protein HID58_071452 [Brassica napus]